MSQAQEAESAPKRDWFGHAPLYEWTRVTGDWGGARTALEDHGLEIDASYTSDWSEVWKGGVTRRDTYRSKTDFQFSYDLEQAFGWRGATMFLDAYFFAGRNGSADVGNIQVYSNLDLNRDIAEVAELWLDQRLFDDRLRVKLGKVDANSEFAFVNSAAEFINSSAGYTPTIFVFPSYPDPATSVNLIYRGGQVQTKFGFYDGAGAEGIAPGGRGPSTFFSDSVASSYFMIAEVDVGWSGPDGEAVGRGAGRIAIGGWYHTGEFERVDGQFSDGTHGVYAVGEQSIFREDDATQGLDLLGMKKTLLTIKPTLSSSRPPNGPR